MKKLIRIIASVCLAVLLLTACKSTRTVTTTMPPKVARYLSSKLQVAIPYSGGAITATGTMKLKEGERVQISILMPIIRTEIARIELTPNEILIIDRTNRRYVRASRKELEEILPVEASYEALEKMLFSASLPQGKKELDGKQLGIPLLENTKVKLYGFSSNPLLLMGTEISDKYTEVPLPVLLKMLNKL